MNMQVTRLCKAALGFLVLLMLTGCWDQVDLQDVTYVSAIGVDYAEGKYKLYAHVVAPSAIAKKESGESADNAIVSWIGQAEGESMLIALSNLAKVSQYEVSIEHMKSIVLSERALPHLEAVFDAMNRQRATRGTIWVFASKGKIEQLFESEMLSTGSPLDSVLYAPEQVVKRVSFFKLVPIHWTLRKKCLAYGYLFVYWNQ